MRRRTGRRLLWLSLLSFVVFGALGWRLYHVQVTMGPDYALRAHRQRALSLPVSARGDVLDRHGLSLTDPRPAWGVGLFPPLIEDPVSVARTLAPMLGLTEKRIVRRLAQGRDPFWLTTRASASEAAHVDRLQLPGVVVGPTGDRFGPGALARQLVGYINAQGGQQGLERAYDQELAGEAVPQITAYLDGLNRPRGGQGPRTMLPWGSPPYSLHTTLDARLQHAVEQVLDRHGAPHGGPLKATVVVMDPDDGDLLVMASRPHFAYEHLDQLITRQAQGSYVQNRAVTAYPPGSVFKAFIAAAAIEEGKVSPDEAFYCPGHYTIGANRFTDPGAGHGSLTFAEAVAQSCNITFLQVGYERLGIEGLRAAAERFGFGRATVVMGRPWAEEAPGNVPVDAASGAIQIAFGQGELAVTPLQVARGFAAIANGGILPPVRLVTSVRSPTGEVISRPATEQAQRVISRQTAQLTRQMLQGVTIPSGQGTGRRAWVEGAGSAGKTGSAEAGGGVVHAWFAGYLPVAAPRYVIVVLVEEGGAGGTVAAPLFREVGAAILSIAGP